MNKILFFLIFALNSLFAADAPVPTQDQTPVPTEENLPAEQMPPELPLSYKGAFTKMMVTLLALIILIVITVWMLRRISGGRFSQMQLGRTIKVLERRPLSGKSVLYVVEVGKKKVLIAESQLEVRRLATLDELISADE